MNNISTYITEKLKINKNSKVEILVDFTKHGERFSDEEKQKCVELSYNLPKLPRDIIDGERVYLNSVILGYERNNNIRIYKTIDNNFHLEIFSHKYSSTYHYPSKQSDNKLKTIEEVFDHIKHYFKYHKEWFK